MSAESFYEFRYIFENITMPNYKANFYSLVLVNYAKTSSNRIAANTDGVHGY